MMMGIIAVTPVMANAAETEETPVESVTETAVENESEAHEVTVINWDDKVKEMEEKGYSGTIYTIDDLGMRLMIPDGMKQRERTQEEADSKISCVFADESEAHTVKIRYDYIEGCTTLEDVAKVLASSTSPAFNYGFHKVNGLDVLIAVSQDADTMTAIINAGEGTFVQVVCSPISDASIADQFRYVVASIQAIEK